MMFSRKLLVLWCFIGCLALAAPSKVRDDSEDVIDRLANMVEDQKAHHQNHASTGDVEVTEVSDEETDDADDDDDNHDDEVNEHEFAEKIAKFMSGYKKTIGEINAGIEVINSHIEKTSRKIGQEIKNTFARIRQNREEL